DLLRIAERVDRQTRRQGGKASGSGDRPRAETRRRGEAASSVLSSLSESDDVLLKLPLLAYPDRVCRRRASDPAAGVMVGGGGVRLAPESVVRQHEFFLALDARHDQRNPKAEAIVSIASGIDVAWLEEMFPQEIRRERGAVYDEHRDR